MLGVITRLVENERLRRRFTTSHSLALIGKARKHFSHRHYAGSYPELGLKSESESWAHFLERGWQEFRDPTPFFSTCTYLALNPDVAEARINPFLHYISDGRAEGRLCAIPGFPPESMAEALRDFSHEHYTRACPELDLKGKPESWAHFLERGWREGRDPSENFSTRAYLDANPDVEAAEVNPFLHFVARGRAEGRLGKPEDVFCISPFLELNVMPTGAVRPCCAFWESVMENGRPMSVYEHTVEELWNSDHLRDIRRKMVAGMPIPECRYCSEPEKRGEPSMRTDLNRGWELQGYANPRQETIEQLKATAFNNDFRMPAGPAWIGLELGNLCNLKCRMCSSTWSSSIQNDPVHSRWSTYDIPSAARWQARSMTIAPRRALGLEYDGLSQLDRTGAKPLAWMQGATNILMKSGGREVAAARIKMTGADVADCPVRLFINRELVFQGNLVEGSLDQTVITPERLPETDEFLFQIHCATRVGIEDLSLIRAETGKSSVAISRFEDGRQWYQDEDFLIREVLGKSDNIAKLHMVGGEPLLIKEARSVMKRLIERGTAKNVLLSLVTNGTVANDEVRELASHFGQVNIGLSMDGVGAVNDYIREGSKWSDIDANILRLKQVPNSTIYVNLAFQAYNMLHVADVAAFVVEAGIGFRYEFLVSPAHLSCTAMPQEARDLAVAKIRHFVEHGAPRNDDGRQRHAHICEILLRLANVIEANRGPHDPSLLRAFMTFTNDLDRTRGQSFSEVNSELLQIIEATGVQWSGSQRFAHYANDGGKDKGCGSGSKGDQH